MKTTHLRMLCLVLSLLFLFGCAPQGEKPSGSADTTPSEASTPTDASNSSAPSAPSGSIPVVDPSEIPAAPVTFDLNTAMRSSSGKLWETEAGYYCNSHTGLIYADKSDLSNWVIVCNKPNCEHDEDTCPAKVGGGFYLKDGRIYSVRSTSQITPDADTAHAVYSVSADGSDDFRLEYPLKRMSSSQGGSMLITWRPDALYVIMSVMGTDGTYENSVTRIDEDGEKLLNATHTQDSPALSDEFSQLGIGYGDMVVLSTTLSGTETLPSWGYVLTKDGYEELPNVDKYKYSTGCFKDGKLYRLVPNDGYYCTDLPADQSVKWMDAQLKDSAALIFGTNCIVEHTMWRSRDSEPQEEPQMRYYNGTEWKAVTLPDKIWTENTLAYNFWAITSTHMIMSIVNREGDELVEVIYMVDLTQDELEAVRCAEIS